jgi:hypothetical protein
MSNNWVKEIFNDKWYESITKAFDGYEELIINNRTKIEQLTGDNIKIDDNYALRRAGQWLSSLS